MVGPLKETPHGNKYVIVATEYRHIYITALLKIFPMSVILWKIDK